MPLHVVPLYAGLSGLILLALSIQATRMRVRYRVNLGDGGEIALQRAMRAQANFVEYVPLALVLLVALELTGTAAWVLHVLGGALVIGRVAHGIGLNRAEGRSPGRALGISLTWLVLLIASVLAIV